MSLMDITDDLSPRVLLQRILEVEEGRTPLTRSAVAQSTSGFRRSSRLSKTAAGAWTPQSILRQEMKRKIQESVSRKSFSNKRRTASSVLKNTNTLALSSVLYDGVDEVTPRQLLKNIMQTEPVKPPEVHKHAESEDLQPELPSAISSLQSSYPSFEQSGLELPNLTGNISSTVKGLRRKRSHRSFNVTAFEKRFKEGIAMDKDSVGEHSSLSLSSTSLDLKTPFIDVQTEKKRLHRRVSNRRKINEEEFRAAVNKNYHGESSFVPEQGLSETAGSEGFTLDINKLTKPDITLDVVNCNTALYPETDGIMSNCSTLETQGKPTVVTSQLQRDMEEQLHVKNNETYSLPMEEKTSVDSQDDDQTEPEDENTTGMSQSEQEQCVEKLQSSGIKDPAESDHEQPQSEEADSQTEDDAAAEGQTENKDEIDAQSADEVSEKGVSAVGQQRDQNVSVMSSRLEKEGRDSRTNDEDEDGERKQLDNLEYISQRAQCSESGLIMPITEIDGVLPDTTRAGYSDAKSKDRITSNLYITMDIEPSEVSGLAKSSTHTDASYSKAGTDANAENSFHEKVTQKNDLPEDVIEEDEHDPSEDVIEDEEHCPSEDVIEEEEHGLSEDVIEEEEHGPSEDVIEEEEHDPSEEEEHDPSEDVIEEEEQDPSEEEEHGPSEDVIEEEEHGPSEDVIEEEEHGPSEDVIEEEEHNPSEDVIEEEEHGPSEDVIEEEEHGPSEEEQSGDSYEEENDEIPTKTPAFVKEKRKFFFSHPQASSFGLKNIQSGDTGLPAAKPKKRIQRKPRSARSEPGLPKSYLMNVFKHFAKTKVSADVYPVLNEIMDKFFDRLAKDLEAYALHARRSTIEVGDCELLLKRQRHTNDKVPVEVLIEKYLRMDQRKLLIPIATSGNCVSPKKR